MTPALLAAVVVVVLAAVSVWALRRYRVKLTAADAGKLIADWLRALLGG